MNTAPPQVQSKVNLKYDSWHKEVLSKFGQMLGSNMTEFHTQISKVRGWEPAGAAGPPAPGRPDRHCCPPTVPPGAGAALRGHSQHLRRGDLHHLRAVSETEDQAV